MKTEKLVWGLILVFIGGILLLENFDVIDFYWSSIWRFWPLLLILIGVNMIFSRSDMASGPYVALVTTLVVLIFIGYQGTRPPSGGHWYQKYNFNYNDDSDDEDGDADTLAWTGSRFSEPYNGLVKHAELNITGGASAFSIEDTTTQLVSASVKQGASKYVFTTESRFLDASQDSLKIVNLKMLSKNHNNKFNLNDVEGNDLRVMLNTAPEWDINVKVGAGDADFDLTRFKVSSLSFHGGAASFKAKLGEPGEGGETRVTAETGIAEVNIKVPKTVGCRIFVKSGLSSKDFSGFTKRNDGSYVTSNFDSAAKKIIINLKGGLSEFNVSRYE